MTEKKILLTGSDVRKAFINTIPVMSGYVVLGIGFGVILKSMGYGFFWCFACSAFIYAGSMQYVLTGLMASGAGLVTVALTTLMVNARHLFYGISMIDRYKKAGKWKPYLIFALTDETYSLLCENELPSEETARRKQYQFWTLMSFMDQCYWVIGSVLGTVLGTVLKFNFDGIDFSLTALFITVFVQQWLDNKDHMPAITGVTASVVCLLIFGSDNFLIPTMLLITAIMTGRRMTEKKLGKAMGAEDEKISAADGGVDDCFGLGADDRSESADGHLPNNKSENTDGHLPNNKSENADGHLPDNKSENADGHLPDTKPTENKEARS